MKKEKIIKIEQTISHADIINSLYGYDIAVIDLFCGAGGVTTGIEESGKAKVILCINHDLVAIASHFSNYPDAIHLTEDIRKVNVQLIAELVNAIKKAHTNIKIAIWASLECTNFSKAKGGLPRDADSRTLANDLLRYLDAIHCDMLWIENVSEFMSWGPLDKNGKPISKLAGKDYLRWVRNVKKYGFKFDYKLLNAADYGAYTSRTRFFAQFVKPGQKIIWPKPTHSKKPEMNKTGILKKWKPVKDVLNFSDEGESIFNRDTNENLRKQDRKHLSEKTLQRIYAGLIKFVAGGKDAFIYKQNFHPEKNLCSLDAPIGTITTNDHHVYTHCHFLSKYYSGNDYSRNNSVELPSGTITTNNRFSLINCCFLTGYYSSGDSLYNILNPCGCITTKDRFNLVQPQFLDCQYSNGQKFRSVEIPCGSLTVVPKFQLVTAKPWLMDTNFNNTGQTIDQAGPVITANHKWHYLMNPQYFNNGSDTNAPCFTLIARMDKKPPYLITTESGQIAIQVYETDSTMTIKIKEFMAMYGIVDVKMRMLRVPELIKIQGFPETYILKGSQADQKKFIGNSVPPPMVKALFNAITTNNTKPLKTNNKVA